MTKPDQPQPSPLPPNLQRELTALDVAARWLPAELGTDAEDLDVEHEPTDAGIVVKPR